MRPIEILFVTLGVLVIVLVGFAPLFPIVLVGFAPLFPSEPPERRIKHECRLFYGPSGDAAVEACLNRMGHYTRQTNHPDAQAQYRHDDLFLNSRACVTTGLVPAIHAMILTRTLGT